MFLKKARVIKFQENVSKESNDLLFLRLTDSIKTKNDRVEVPYTHVVFIVKGDGSKYFYDHPGTYPIFRDKKEVKLWKDGGSVEIIFMARETDITIFWGVPDKFLYRDFLTKKVVRLGAHGQFRIIIKNYENFLKKIIGSLNQFSSSDFGNNFRMDVTNEFRDCFLDVVYREQLPYDQFSRNLKRIAHGVGERLSNIFENSWGIGLEDFIIKGVSIEETDTQAIEEFFEEEKAERKEKERMQEQERLDDKQWEREKYLAGLEYASRSEYYDVLKKVGHPNTGEKKSQYNAQVVGN